MVLTECTAGLAITDRDVAKILDLFVTNADQSSDVRLLLEEGFKSAPLLYLMVQVSNEQITTLSPRVAFGPD